MQNCKNVLNYDVVDIPSKIFKKIMDSKSQPIIKYENALKSINDLELRNYADILANKLEDLLTPSPSFRIKLKEVNK